MTATFDEQVLGGTLRWVIARGPRDVVFRELGALAEDDIAAVLEAMPERAKLERYVSTEPGRTRFADLVAVTRQRFPREAKELDDIAAGAGRGTDELWLANLRGDVGAADGTGCSDLGWCGRRSLVAHNEDGAAVLHGRLMLLTLAVDGEVPVTVLWYPGFVPANAFCATGNGLVWGIDHLPVSAPALAPGRHFVARAAQHVSTMDELAQFLARNPSAGGFAYTAGEIGTGRVLCVETAAGRTATTEPDPLLWHTNHARWLNADDGALGELGRDGESRVRGDVLRTLTVPDEPDSLWFQGILRGPGVFRSAEGDDPLLTLCTVVTDLTANEVTVVPRDGVPVTLPFDAVLSGTAPDSTLRRM